MFPDSSPLSSMNFLNLLVFDMTPQEILELEISLLLIKYGKDRVLKTFAKKIEISNDELIQKLSIASKISQNRTQKKKGPRKPFSIEPLFEGREDKADLLTALQARFKNRTFLPELRDVKRFLDRNTNRAISLKSRSAAEKILFTTLANLDKNTLKDFLSDTTSSNKESSLGLISDEILGSR
jgi:hypothetical protein